MMKFLICVIAVASFCRVEIATSCHVDTVVWGTGEHASTFGVTVKNPDVKPIDCEVKFFTESSSKDGVADWVPVSLNNEIKFHVSGDGRDSSSWNLLEILGNEYIGKNIKAVIVTSGEEGKLSEKEVHVKL